MSPPHHEFIKSIEPKIFARLADPYDRYRRDQYIQKNTPSRFTLYLQLATHILDDNTKRLNHLVKHAASQTTPNDIDTLNQKVDDAYNAIILTQHEYFTTLAQELPRATLQNILFCNPITATQHLQNLEQHPLNLLLLAPQTLASINLSPTTPIKQALTAKLPPKTTETLEKAWKTYVTEQRLLKIIGDVQQNPFFYESTIIAIVFQLADTRFLDTKLTDITLEKRFETYLIINVCTHLEDNYISRPYSQLTLNHLLNADDGYEPFDFDTLPKATKTHVTEALIQHLSTWRQTAFPTTTPLPTQPTPAPVDPTTQSALNALEEINDLFES